MSDIFSQMAEEWKLKNGPVIARRKIDIFTCGAMSPKSAANLDSLGLGCPEHLLINGHICYPVDSFVSWLRDRSAASAKKKGAL